MKCGLLGVRDVALRLLVVARQPVAHQLVREGARDAVDREGVARVLESGGVPAGDDRLEHAPHGVFTHGIEQLRSADRRVAQARGGGDGALGVGRV